MGEGINYQTESQKINVLRFGNVLQYFLWNRW